MKFVPNIDKVKEPQMQRRSIYWGTMNSPLGKIYAAVDHADALRLLVYGDSIGDFMANISRFGQPIQDTKQLARVFEQLDEYFNGRRSQFDLLVDLSALSPFQQKVLAATRQIPYGSVASYKTIAMAINKPGTSRAVGGALANNSVGIIVPCHRVVAADGSLGGFSGAGGLDTKRFLLDLESGK